MDINKIGHLPILEKDIDENGIKGYFNREVVELAELVLAETMSDHIMHSLQKKNTFKKNSNICCRQN